MVKKYVNAPLISVPVWLNPNHVEQTCDLLEGIPERQQVDKYVKAVEQVLPQLAVEDGVVALNDIWLETSLPRDLLRYIVDQRRFVWPANVERIQIGKATFVDRPHEEELQA